MGKQTPIAQKVRKSTPKTVPNKLRDALNTTDVAIELKRASFQRTKLDLNDAPSIDIASICTPVRTTRSMARYVSGEILPPLPAIVTPSKRKTITITKSSLSKNSLIKERENALDGEFVRPKVPKLKISDTSFDKLPAPKAVSKRQSGRKAAIVREKEATSSEDDLPSVSMLGVGSSTQKAGKLVRSRKVRESKDDIVSTDEEDLPSVSILGSENSPGRYVRSPEWMRSKDSATESNDDENVLNDSKATAGQFVRPRKSIDIEHATIESNENGLKENDGIDSKTSNEEVTLATDPSVDNGSKTDTTRESINPGPAPVESKSARQSKQSIENQPDSSDDGLLSVSMLAILKPARKSMRKRVAELPVEPSPVKRTVKFTSPIVIENPKSNVDESYDETSIEPDRLNQGREIQNQNLDENIDKKPLIANNRVSIIDLTESPANSNRSLNTTFSLEEDSTTDADVAINRKFTEESNNDKAVSPVPSTATNVAYLTPLVKLNSASTSASKKKSPQLKRLKGTPLRKLNNLNTPAKVSSAKKLKIVETAFELCSSSAKKQMQPPKLNTSTPKLFRFGADDNKGHDFRFSLLAPSLNPCIPSQNSKYLFSALKFIKFKN